MKNKGTDTDNKDIIKANVGEENDAFDNAVQTDSSPPQDNAPSEIQALLVAAMNLVTDNDVMREHIAKALNASAHL